MRLRHAFLPAIAVTSLAAFGACDNDSPLADPTTEPETSAPAGTAAGSTEPATSAPGSEPATSTPAATGPGSSVPGAECSGDPTVDTASAVAVGLSEVDAEAALDECGWILRVIRLDGEDLPMTMDLRPNRVNVEVTDGTVTAVLNIG